MYLYLKDIRFAKHNINDFLTITHDMACRYKKFLRYKYVDVVLFWPNFVSDKFIIFMNTHCSKSRKLLTLSAQKIRIICFAIKHLFAFRKLKLIATNWEMFYTSFYTYVVQCSTSFAHLQPKTLMPTKKKVLSLRC